MNKDECFYAKLYKIVLHCLPTYICRTISVTLYFEFASFNIIVSSKNSLAGKKNEEKKLYYKYMLV